MAVTNYVPIDGHLHEVKRASVGISTATTTAVVAAVTGKQIVVLDLFLVSNGANLLTIKNGSTALTGAVPVVDGVPLSMQAASPELAPFHTTAGSAFNITTTGATIVSGYVLYVLI